MSDSKGKPTDKVIKSAQGLPLSDNGKQPPEYMKPPPKPPKSK